MLAVDTNVIVRYLTNDHPQQSRKAKALIEGREVFACTTVLLETEWVLRGVYGFKPMEVAKALQAFAGLPMVTVEEPAILAKALGWTSDRNMDFADALLLAKAQSCGGLASFDRKFVRLAKAVGGIEVTAL